VPAGKTKLVQPLEAGIVRAIHVQDGDKVKAGDLLVELDPTAPGADSERLAHDLMSSKLDVARLTALKRDADTGKGPGPFTPPDGASPRDIELARASLDAQLGQQADKIASLDQQIRQKRAEADEVGAEIAKLKATMPLMAEKEERRKELLRLEFGNRFAYLDAQQALIEAQHNLLVQGRRAVELDAARASLERERDETHSEYKVGILSDLADAEQKVSQQTQDLVKADRKTTETSLRAPIDGVVQQLAIHTIGGVVTPAQQLMVLVPSDDAGLVVEAMLPNRDVGFVHPGQDVEVKVETFTFTRYGLLHGHVVDVSRDTVTEDQRKPDDGGRQPPDDKNGQPQSGSPAYVARVQLDRASLMVDGEERSLGPGMAVTAEIKTGSRQIINYLLSPLRAYRQGSFTER